MSIHISSNNVSNTVGNGKIYDGTWILNGTVKGQYEVVDQTIDWTTIPWITNSTNTVEFTNETETIVFLLFNTPELLATYQTSLDIDAIATYIQSRWNYVGSLPLYPNFTCVVTVNSSTLNFELQFSKTLTLVYGANATIQSLFNTGTANITGSLHLWSYANIDVHPHLFLKVAEMNNTIMEKDMQNVSMIFHTQDNPLLGMRVSIPSLTDRFTIKMYTANQPNEVVAITSPWEFVLKSV